MIRRLFTIATVLSAMLAVLSTAIAIRGRFWRDEFQRCRWDPATRTYGEVRIVSWGGELWVRSEVATATATENTAVVQQKAGPNGTCWTHTAASAMAHGFMGRPQFIWMNRYRAGPLVGINPRGLADCVDMICRIDLVAAAFAVLPAVWILLRLKRRLDRRGAPRRGFVPVVQSS